MNHDEIEVHHRHRHDHGYYVDGVGGGGGVQTMNVVNRMLLMLQGLTSFSCESDEETKDVG